MLRSQRSVSSRRARTMMTVATTLVLGSIVMLLIARSAPNLPPELGVAASARSKTTTRTASTDGATAEIVTCPACRLNALPKVKSFVHGAAKLFAPQLTVKFEFGRDPHLHLYNNGKQVEDIDLAPLDGATIMKRLYAHGVRPTKRTEEISAALGKNALLQRTTHKSA